MLPNRVITYVIYIKKNHGFIRTTIRHCTSLIYRLFNFKNKIIARLRAMIMNKDSGGIYGSVRNENPYNVPYRPHASSNVKSDWTCNMASSVERFRTLEKDDISHPLTDHIPDVPLFDDDEIFDTCAIISNAATLRNSNLGYFIGEHI